MVIWLILILFFVIVNYLCDIILLSYLSFLIMSKNSYWKDSILENIFVLDPLVVINYMIIFSPYLVFGFFISQKSLQCILNIYTAFIYCIQVNFIFFLAKILYEIMLLGKNYYKMDIKLKEFNELILELINIYNPIDP